MKWRKIKDKRIRAIIVLAIIILLINCYNSIVVQSVSVNQEGLYSKNIILVDYQNTNVLYEKSSDTKIYPASMTKIMSTIIILEQTDNFDKKVIVPDKIFSSLYKKDASLAGFSAGDYVTIKELLYGTMLPSGAEAIETLAIKTVGSKKNLVKLMNKKTQELGLKNTNFTNVTGLHDSNQVTTVAEMSKIFSYALKNKQFLKLISTPQYQTNSTPKYPNGLVLNSTLFSKFKQSEIENGKIIGGKTGYTSDAGQCLASFAKIKDKYYVLITAGAPRKNHSEQNHIKDAINIYNKVIDNKY